MRISTAEVRPTPRKLSDWPRVAIVAENASLRFGGEAALPFHFFRVLRKRKLEAWLIVHERCREAVEEAFADDLDHVIFVPDLLLHRLLYGLGKPLPERLSMMTSGTLLSILTQWQLRREVRSLVDQGKVDLVHQPIPVSPRLPTLMSRTGVPMIMGPMNGGMDFPEAFRTFDGSLTRLLVELGRRASNLANRIVDGKLRADLILVANERTARNLPDGIHGEVIPLVENGVDLGVWSSPQPSPDSEKDGVTRFLYLGRLVDWKAVDLLLEAFARVVAKTPARLTVIGDGPVRPALQTQAAQLGLSNVEFLGWQDQSACAEHLARADALVLPSLYECGGAVVLEAMAMGRAVIATDWGGPADYLDPSCGILVAPTSRDGFIAGLADAMLRLDGDAELRRRMGAAGRQKVLDQFTWERKGDRILELYRRVLDRARSTNARVASA